MKEKDNNDVLFLVMKTENNMAKREINKILNNYIEENKDSLLLNSLKDEINKYFDTRFEENRKDEEIKENIKEVYKYSAEILKIYNKEYQFGITIKAEYQNETLVNLEGFTLDFNRLQLDNISEDEIKPLFEYYNIGEKNENEKIAVLNYTNKDLCDLNYEEIQNNFIEKNKIRKINEETEDQEI